MFWSDLHLYGDKTAVIEGTEKLTYEELVARCDEIARQLGVARKLVFVFATNNISGLIAYLACLRAGHVVMMIDPGLDKSKLDVLFETYLPNFYIEQERVTAFQHEEYQLDQQLALLLSTSGSTGSAKQVALSFDNLQHNADAICQYLPIRASDKTISTLPLFYSYGLSVINTHLNCGATIVFTEFSMLNRQFWALMEAENINSFAAVPHNYDMLLRLKFPSKHLPELRYFTQAGGKLAKQKVQQLATYAKESNKQFFVMYGQTEATARMAYLEPELASTNPSSIGQAIPMGKFELRDERGRTITQPKITGEILYQGPNVMLGYADSVEDLSQFGSIESLETGDLGYMDEQGLYFIVGRKKRFIKLFGKRINLDDIESYFSKLGVESMCSGNDAKLVVAVKNVNNINDLKKDLSQTLNVHSSVIEMLAVSELPINANGKKDYTGLLAQAGGCHD